MRIPNGKGGGGGELFGRLGGGGIIWKTYFESTVPD